MKRQVIVAHLKRFLQSDILVLLMLFLMAFAYYQPIIDKAPFNMHLWRQTDCLSLTENYYKGAPFLSPELHILLGNHYETGKSAGEFPIIYYTVSIIWKIFGPTYLSYRLFIGLFLFIGLWAFHQSVKFLLNNKFWAAWLVSLFFTSPVLVVYGTSFITDVPAFSFALLGCYAFIRYRLQGVKKLFWWSMIFFAFAGLLKVSSLIVFVFLGGIYLLELLSIKTFNGQKVFKKPRFEWAGFALVLIINFIWYAYAEYYNNQSGFRYTFNSIYPIWTTSAPELDTLWEDLILYIKPVFFSRWILFLMAFMAGFNLFIFKKVPLFVYLANAVILLGAASYFVLWAPLMGVHDYYYIAMLIIFPATFLTFFYYLQNNYPNFLESIPAKVFGILLLIMSFSYCYQVIQTKNGQEHDNLIVLDNKAYENLMVYFNWEREANIGKFERIRPYLKEIGVRPEDKVISLPDNSFSISLYFMGQKGWTNREFYSSSDQIQALVDKGAKYLLLADTKLLEEQFLQPFMTQKVGEFENIAIYKLQ